MIDKKMTKYAEGLRSLEVKIEDCGSFERMVKRFKKKLKEDGIIERSIECCVFTKPSDKKRKKRNKRKRINEFEKKELLEQEKRRNG